MIVKGLLSNVTRAELEFSRSLIGFLKPCSTTRSGLVRQLSSTVTQFSSDGRLSTSDEKLKGKVAVVTGGSNGLGEACVREFVEAGAKVVIADVQDELGYLLEEELSPSALYVHCNVINESDVENAVIAAVEKFGALDIMHNNAGIGGKPCAIQDMDMADFDTVLGVCFKSVIVGLKHAARVMIPKERGVILNTCSVAGVIAGVAPSPYAFAKGGVPHITKQAAAELGKYGIRVNCISPLGVPTMNALRTIRTIEGFENLTFEEYAEKMDKLSELKNGKLRSEHFARSALYLVSEDSSFTSGHNLVLDGGFHFQKPYKLDILKKKLELNYNLNKTAAESI